MEQIPCSALLCFDLKEGEQMVCASIFFFFFVGFPFRFQILRHYWRKE